jgi:phospholipase C
MTQGPAPARLPATTLLAALLAASLTVGAAAPPARAAPEDETATPIKYVVVIFQENVSFDHYFATYPVALNPPGQPRFEARPGTPTVNGISGPLLTHNPNRANPFRLDRSQALTCDNDHAYTAEQRAYNGGLMNRFVEFTDQPGRGCLPNNVMGHYDGNTVTALWHYAQYFALSDNHFATNFGQSARGHLNLISGQTHGAIPPEVPGAVAQGTMFNDVAPAFDDCPNPYFSRTVEMTGRHVGDLLNARGITWGWFQGGFRPTERRADGTAVCGSAHANIGGHVYADYLSHHEPFQYYRHSANPHHLPPTSVAMIGRTDQANHQYDLEDFWAAAAAGNVPAVSFLKPPAYQDGHAGYSDPLDEQVFLVETINRLQRLPQWSRMAIFIAYDDSDGWYDHVMPPIVNPSSDPAHDALLGPGLCGFTAPGAYQNRCGYGPRLPLLVVSPWARENFVDHTLTDQTSILRFIEDNWDLGRIGDQSLDELAGSLLNMFDFTGGPRAIRLLLDPETGLVVAVEREERTSAALAPGFALRQAACPGPAARSSMGGALPPITIGRTIACESSHERGDGDEFHTRPPRRAGHRRPGPRAARPL